MNPQQHQRAAGEREHYPRQEAQSGVDERDEYVAHKREKAEKNNTHRNEQTGHAEAEAKRTRDGARRAA